MDDRTSHATLSRFGQALLYALQPHFRDAGRKWLGVRHDRPRMHVYEGTASELAVARRRARNRVARRSRRVNRLRAR